MAISSRFKPTARTCATPDMASHATEGDSANSDPFGHLPHHEALILRRQLEKPDAAKATWSSLFRFASRQDMIIIAVSSICAIAAGAAVPLNTVILGSLAGAFQDFTNGISRSEFDARVNRQTLYFVYLAVGEFFTIYIATIGFKYTGESITRKIREQYLKALLRQNAAFFDQLGPGEIITRISADTNVVQEGLSEKIELALSAISTFIAAYVVGFVKYWKLTLIMTSMTPVMVLLMYGLKEYVVKYTKLSLAAHGQGVVVIEEALSSIRTVTGFGTQESLAKEYNKSLDRAQAFGLRAKCIMASGVGALIGIFNLGYALASWMGSKYIINGETNLPAVFTILLVLMLGSFALGKAVQHIQAFVEAAGAASAIYATIDRVPPWGEHTKQGKVMEKVEGHIELRNVKHIYPSRPDVVVMQNLSLNIPAGHTVAITGPSGSGKSTIVALLERFYSPVSGELLLDGCNIEDADLHWLRQQIGLVSQDPNLFSGTVEDNILHGLRGAAINGEHSKRYLAEKAARLADAHEFIMMLPKGYDTFIGERGSSLSGGQRQRIAIARAVVSDPKILLLDEATSALDSKTEEVVQAALERAAQGRTTIIISHRMSTIKNVDTVVVMAAGGNIVEQGTYEYLLAAKGAFYELVEAQNMAQNTKSTGVDWDEKANPWPYEAAGGEKALDLQSVRKISLDSLSDADAVPVDDSATTIEKPRRKASLWSLIQFTCSMNRKEWKVMLLGIIASIVSGAGEPVQCVILAKAIVTLSLPPTQYPRLRSDIALWSGMFVMIAFVMLACSTVLGLSFAYGSERLIHRSRDQAFRSILRQDITFFDRSENTVGSLTSFLSTETTHLAGMSGLALGTIFQLLATLIIGYIVALAVGWKLALVCIATVPILLLAGFLSIYSMSRFEAHLKDAYRESASYACEATSSTKTIAALTLENAVWQKYHNLLVAQASRSFRFNVKSSVLYAASQSLGFLCMALAFWYGSSLIGTYSLEQFYLVFFLVIFGTRSAANMFSLAPNMAKAKVAAAELKTFFEQTPAIDVWSSDGDVLDNLQGSIEFRDVHFAYPTGQPVLAGLNFKVQPGQYVALVGASGCGKSTTIALLERFYDPTNGTIYVDGKDITTLHLSSYRKHIALVLQEPTLYQGTIRQNLLLAINRQDEEDEEEDEEGKAKSQNIMTTIVPEEKLIQVCKEANIYDFITSLPAGFDTVVGSKGCMLSGGQKQRIAIARALLRDAKILLLDEATSALDSESEGVVQKALDAAARGRTTIAVAHRLSTVRNADAILVFDNADGKGGRIVESGTHATLMALRGRYFELVQLQSSESNEEVVT